MQILNSKTLQRRGHTRESVTETIAVSIKLSVQVRDARVASGLHRSRVCMEASDASNKQKLHGRWCTQLGRERSVNVIGVFANVIIVLIGQKFV